MNISFNILMYVLVTLAGGKVVSSENPTPGLNQLSLRSPPCIQKKVKPLLLTHIEKKSNIVPQIPPSTNNERKIQPLIMQKVLPAHIKTLDNSIQIDVLTNKVPYEKVGDGGLASTLPDYTLIENIDKLYRSAVRRSWKLWNEVLFKVFFKDWQVGKGIGNWIEYGGRSDWAIRCCVLDWRSYE